MKVLKFGGTSVANAENINRVLTIVTEKAKNEKLVVVVSALSKVTDLLQLASQKAASNDESYKEILSEREGALKIQRNCNILGMDWIWLPLANGNIPNEKMNIEISEKLRTIKTKLQNQEKIYVHCSAGLHRTGMITNCILRYIGLDQISSYEILKQLRPITAKEVGKKRLDFGEQFYNVII